MTIHYVPKVVFTWLTSIIIEKDIDSKHDDEIIRIDDGITSILFVLEESQPKKLVKDQFGDSL